MIGTNIRGIRHLFRMSDTSLTPLIIKFQEYGYDFCWAIRTKKEGRFGDTLVIFNNHCKSPFGSSIGTYLDDEEFKPFHEQISRCYKAYTVTKDSINDRFHDLLDEIIMLPKTFESDYEAFLNGNAKLIRTLREKYGFDTRDLRMKRLYMYSDGSKNFFQWAVTAYFGLGVTMNTIKAIFQWNESYGQLAKNLSKGTITAYTSKSSIEALMTEMSVLRKNKRIADTINSFNTAQKKLLKNNELNDIEKETLAKFSGLSETKRINFIKKVSTINDFTELMRQMRNVCSVHFSWNKESFNDYLENVEGLNYKKIFENDNVVLVEVNDYDTVKQLAKTTNWCISKNKSYWNNYVEHDKENTHQYLVFDFSRKEDDKLSIVGFTVKHNKGITNAHDFVNNNLMENDSRVSLTLLKSYISKFLSSNNIYSILSNDGIDINIVSNYDEPLYKWDKESVINYLYECVNQENTDILISKDNKIAISVKDENIRYFLGDTYYDNISEDYWGNQHILFMDFSLSKYDINKLQFAIIESNCNDEDYCEAVYNEHSIRSNKNFETKLIEFGLPYDIIRRTNNVYVKMYNAFCTYNVPMIKECVENMPKKDLLKFLDENIGEDGLYNMLTTSVRDYMSLDYIDILYGKGILVSEVIGNRYSSELCIGLISQIVNMGRQIDAKYEIPSEKDMHDFYEEEINNKQFAMYIGSYLFVSKLLDKEHPIDESYNSFAKRIAHAMHNLDGDMFKSLMLKIGHRLDFGCCDDAVFYWLRFAVYHGNDEIKSLAEKKSNSNERMKKYLENIKKEKESYNKKTAYTISASFR